MIDGFGKDFNLVSPSYTKNNIDCSKPRYKLILLWKLFKDG